MSPGVAEDVRKIVYTANDLIKALTFDDSGVNGRGGLISRETIQKADELRIALLRFERTTSR